MTEFPSLSVESLRAALSSSTAIIPSLEGNVVMAQDRLRREITKVEKLRELIALFEADEPTASAEQPTLSVDGLTIMGRTGGGNFKGEGALSVDAQVVESKQSKIEREVTALLRMRGTVHRADLLAHLTNAGIMGHESNPLAHLAAFLSKKRDKFASDGQGRFSLRQSAAQEPLPTPPNGVGSAGVGNTGTAGATRNQRRSISWSP
jgi:hypothetical protein